MTTTTISDDDKRYLEYTCESNKGIMKETELSIQVRRMIAGSQSLTLDLDELLSTPSFYQKLRLIKAGQVQNKYLYRLYYRVVYNRPSASSNPFKGELESELNGDAPSIAPSAQKPQRNTLELKVPIGVFFSPKDNVERHEVSNFEIYPLNNALLNKAVKNKDSHFFSANSYADNFGADIVGNIRPKYRANYDEVIRNLVIAHTQLLQRMAEANAWTNEPVKVTSMRNGITSFFYQTLEDSYLHGAAKLIFTGNAQAQLEQVNLLFDAAMVRTIKKDSTESAVEEHRRTLFGISPLSYHGLSPLAEHLDKANPLRGTSAYNENSLTSAFYPYKLMFIEAAKAYYHDVEVKKQKHAADFRSTGDSRSKLEQAQAQAQAAYNHLTADSTDQEKKDACKAALRALTGVKFKILKDDGETPLEELELAQMVLASCEDRLYTPDEIQARNETLVTEGFAKAACGVPDTYGTAVA